MFFKLSIRNVRKSFGDYTLYFLTLTFGVCVFYIFNSIEAQKAGMSISSSTLEMLKVITLMMSVISVFISVILGFLIVYANNFLIRRRKKEIGIYMTLGMKKSKVARLLVTETFIIGIISLGLGLLAGIVLSQGLSVVIAKLFEADLSGYHFIFSPSAFVKTVIYFGIIFMVVMIMSTISISKYRLINLINAHRQNEKQKLKNPVVTIILFILSIICLGTAYLLVLKNGIQTFDNRILFEVILGAIGTFLFFASLSGFFLKLVQANKKLYFKGLNMFILRQINSRINTAHISMSFICLMLFLTIGVLSSGLGFNNTLNNSYEFCAPFDASFRIPGDTGVLEMLTDHNFNIYDYIENSVEFKLYTKEELTKKTILDRVEINLPDGTNRAFVDTQLYLIKLSDYNALMNLQGKEGINLAHNETALYSDYVEGLRTLKKAAIEFIEKDYSISISGEDYRTYPDFLTNGIVTSPASNIMLAIIVPDKVISDCKIHETILSLNCKGDSKKTQLKLESDLFSFIDKFEDNKQEINIRDLIGSTRVTIKTIAAGRKAVVSFVGIYVGIIFLISSAAVLALQQLSEASDNRQRYDILQKIGADRKLISSALFKQIAIYFILPLLLSCIHSIVGIKVVNDVVIEAGEVETGSNIIITAVLIIVVYGSYFLSTYFSSKRIILRSRG